MNYANSIAVLVDGEVQIVPILDTTKAPAIIETTSGETVSIQDSAVAPFSGLKLFGKATQDGTPSTESPVPIDIAGNGGTVNISVTGGTAETQTLPLSTPNGLPGIPVTSGGNYTDATGQQWISDVIDLEAGTYTQNCAIVTFDGSADENWTYQEDVDVYSIVFTGASGQVNRASMCNRFISQFGVNPQQVDYVCCGFNTSAMYSNYFYLKLKDTIPSESDFISWLQTNPITVLYQLATPVVSQLSSEEISAYKALLTNYPSTNIFSDSKPQIGIEASYTADTKTYIDNKISQAVAIAKA